MKQKILMTYVESGFGHISAMDGIYGALKDGYSDKYDIEKSYIMREDGLPHLARLERFLTKQVENTNKIAYFGKFIFAIVNLLGGDHIMRFVHRQLAYKAWREGLEALEKRKPDIIITNHYFTDMLAVEYKLKRDPNVKVINYNPDCTLHTFWDKRDGVFIVNNQKALDKALKYKFKRENLRTVTPCVRKCVENNVFEKSELRDKFGLPQDRFTVVVADGGYMFGRGPKFAKKIIKKGLPVTLCVIAGKNKKRYEEFKAIAEGRSKIKPHGGTDIRVYEFLDNAYELYGAADVFLTKGGPNAVLDSIYMHTPVMIDFCPHVIEEWTVKIYIDSLGCGETAFKTKKAVKRIEAMMNDGAILDGYKKNIDEFLKSGNGADAIARIIDVEAELQREERRERGIVYEEDGLGLDRATAAESAQKILSEVMTDEDIVVSDADHAHAETTVTE